MRHRPCNLDLEKGLWHSVHLVKLEGEISHNITYTEVHYKENSLSVDDLPF